MFCDQFVIEEWQIIRRFFGGKMVEFWVQITLGTWRSCQVLSSNNISKYLLLLLLQVHVVVWSDTHVLAKWFIGPGGVIYRMGAMKGYTCKPMGCTVITSRSAWSPKELCTHSLQQQCTCRMRAHVRPLQLARLAMRNLAHQSQGYCVGCEGVAQMIYHRKWFQANFWVHLWITNHWYLQKRGIY